MPLQRRDKLAIIIIGKQNTGKTTTLKSYFDYYYEPVTTFRQGWRYKVVPFRPKFETIKIWPFVLPSSRTEKAVPLAKVIDVKWLPEVLLMAEQLYGSEYSNSIHFLMKHEYLIKEFYLSDIVGNGIWDRWEDGNITQEEGKIFQRREEIADFIREFLLSKAC